MIDDLKAGQSVLDERARKKADLFKKVPIADVLSTPPSPPPFVIEHLMPANAVTVLGAHGGGGKTTLGFMAGVSLALELSFLGKRTKQSRVAFFSGEEPAPSIRWKLANVCREMGVDPADLAGHMTVLDASECDATLYDRQGFTTPGYDVLLNMAERGDADVFIIDNASDTFDGDEIRRAEVRGFMRALSKLTRANGGAVLLLVHTDRASARGNGGNDDGYSGSTAWHNSARSRLFLAPDKGGDGLELRHLKCNLGPLADPIPLEWTKSGVLARADGADACAGLIASSHREAVLRLIAEFYDLGDYLPTSANAPGNAYKALSSEPTFPPRMKRAEFWQLIRDAQRAGYLTRETYRNSDRKERERWTVTPSGRLAARIAPSAPTARQVQHGTPGASGAPTAPTSQGGMGGERAHKVAEVQP